MPLSERRLFRVIKPNYEVKAVLVAKIPTIIVYDEDAVEEEREIDDNELIIDLCMIYEPKIEKKVEVPIIIEPICVIQKEIETTLIKEPIKEESIEDSTSQLEEKPSIKEEIKVEQNFDDSLENMKFEIPVYYTREYVTTHYYELIKQ